ncbi:MAG: hypothetical protein EUB_03880 [Eubacterium sp.]|uniref:phosphohydrolase n=1 Tax=Eubacterium sp. TaxID=142586 RepID=UPI003069C9E4
MTEKMHTFTGKKVNPMKLESDAIDIVDIAHALSLLCRGGGHLKYFYSVGQHSINCAEEAIARKESSNVILGCLLHDASEAYLSDLIRPVKKHFEKYIEIENQIAQAIFNKFGLSHLSKQKLEKIKEIDDSLLENELAALLTVKQPRPKSILKSYPNFNERLNREIEQEFLDLYFEQVNIV